MKQETLNRELLATVVIVGIALIAGGISAIFNTGLLATLAILLGLILLAGWVSILEEGEMP